MDLEYYKRYEPIDGKWYIKKELGKGAYGTVFEVEKNDFTKERSALKIITIPSAPNEVDEFRRENREIDGKGVTAYFYGMVEDFIKEIQLMSQLKGYNNIVRYEDHDVKRHMGRIGWDIFIRMELLTPLNEYYSKHNPSEEDIIKLGIDICKALEVCGEYNIIHRDIKPTNIFVSKSGDYKIGDFGVARTLERAAIGLSKKGTYTYMAPEVYKGGRYGLSVDLYSLGIVMYRLMNNNLEPFRTAKTYADGEKALAVRMGGSAPITPPANASEAFSSVILKACAFNPSDRYRTASEMKNDLEILLNGTPEYYEDDLDRTVSVYSRAEMERIKRYAEECRRKAGGTPTASTDERKKAGLGGLRLGRFGGGSSSSDSSSSGSGKSAGSTGSGRFFKRASESTDLTARSASPKKSTTAKTSKKGFKPA